jgi:hypothetical protein
VTVHPEWCPKRDNPIAVALWKDTRLPALLEVRCGTRVHRLAKVYAANGKRWLCLPAFDFIEQFMEQGDVDHGRNMAHLHAALYDLDTRERQQYLRCSHGMYAIQPADIQDALKRGRKVIVSEAVESSDSHKVARGTH